MDGFVSAYAKSTGLKQRIPRHWIGHPVLGRDFELTPSAAAAIQQEAEVEAGGPPSESWTRPALDEHAAALGIDPSGMANKREVLAAIDAAVNAGTPDPAGTPPSDETPATGDTEEE